MDKIETRVPGWYKGAAILAIVWMLFGCVQFFMTLMMTPADMAKLTVTQQELIRNQPAWMIWTFALAVASGLAGAVAMLLRRRMAPVLLAISVLCTAINNFWILGQTKLAAGLSGFDQAMTFLVPAIGAVFLAIAVVAYQRGWLR